MNRWTIKARIFTNIRGTKKAKGASDLSKVPKKKQIYKLRRQRLFKQTIFHHKIKTLLQLK